MKTKLSALISILPLFSVILVLYFLLQNPDELSGTWSGSASRHLSIYIISFFLLLFLTRMIFPTKHKLYFSCSLLAFILIGCGPASSLATLFFVCSCYVLGKLIINNMAGGKIESFNFLASTVTGLACFTLINSFFLLLPINTWSFHFSLITIPFLIYYRIYKSFSYEKMHMESALKDLHYFLNGTNGKIFYGFLFLLTYIATYSFFPTIGHDENTVHLSVWTQLVENRFFTIVPDMQIWSAAPNTVPLLHGIISLLAFTDAKGSLNVAIFLFITLGVFQLLCNLGLEKNNALTTCTLLISTPLFGFLLTGLQADLFLGLMSLVVAISLILSTDNFFPHATAAIMAGALALSAKLPGVLIAVPALITVAVIAIKNNQINQISIKTGLIILLAATLAFWPYIRAYYYTGNPVFPLYNEIFQSPFFEPVNFIDSRWHHGANINSFIGIFFQSSKFLEATNNYVGGFQYFLLAPLSMFLILFLKMRKLYLLILLALCYLAPIFISLQYIRYFFAALPILTILIGSLYLHLRDNKFYKKSVTVSIYTICALNFVFLPGASWMFEISPLTFVKQNNINKTISHFMPELVLNRAIQDQHKNPTILFAFDRPYGATLTGTSIYNSWYSNRYSKEIGKWQNIEDVEESMKNWRVEFIYWDQTHPYNADDIQRNLLREYLTLFGKPFSQQGKILAFSLSRDK